MITDKKSKFNLKNFITQNTNRWIAGFIFYFILIKLPFITRPINYYDTAHTILPFIKNCSVFSVAYIRDPLRYYSLCFSSHILGNLYTIPTLSFLSFLIIVYYYEKNITKSITFSLISVFLILITNSSFYYGFSATYDQTWVTLFFASLLLLNTKHRKYSFIPFIFSLLFRGLPLIDIPIILAQIYILDIPKKEKSYLILIFSTITIGAIIYTIYGGIAISQNQSFQINFDNGLKVIYAFRFDYIFFASSIIECIFLYKIKSKYNGFILFSIIYLFFSSYCLSAFTNLSTESYRLFPLIGFISIGYGSIFYDIWRKLHW